jgi:hypothetical protein
MAGLDAPRPLPAGLRQRLEHSLLEAARAGHRPLGSDLTERLEGALADPVAGAMDGVDAPRPLEPDVRQRLEHALQPRPHRSRFVLAAAAVLALLAGVGLAVGLSGSNTATPQRALSHGSAGNGHPSGTGGSAGVSGGASPNAPVQNLGPSAALPQSAAGNVTAGPSSPQPPPSVSSVTPNSGPAAGGTWVTISGSGLSGARSVWFGGIPAPQVVPVSATSVQALAPAHAAGTVDVQVGNPSSISPPSPQDRYTYR